MVMTVYLKVMSRRRRRMSTRGAKEELSDGGRWFTLAIMTKAPVQLTVPMPANLAKLRFPKALNERLHHLLDEQGRTGRLSLAQKKELQGLSQMESMLSILKLSAQVKAGKA